jgi:hypothetical protein
MNRRSLEAEIVAARTTAAKAGLDAVEPEVVKLGKHATLKLVPLPIVARVGSASSVLSMEREISVGHKLAALDAPVVRPIEGSPGPYIEHGCAITFWDFIAGRKPKGRKDSLAAARALQRVHEALTAADPQLPPFTVAIDSCEATLSDPTETPSLSPSDRRFLQGLQANLRQQLKRHHFSDQPLHGDAHLANVLITNAGPVWMDLESICCGPLEWDIINLPKETWSEFSGLDGELMQLLMQVRSLCVAIWCWADFGRNDEISEAATYHLNKLKARFG